MRHIVDRQSHSLGDFTKRKGAAEAGDRYRAPAVLPLGAAPRLVDEVAGLRVQVAQTEAVLRRDMAETGAAIRQEMALMGASIRVETAQMGTGIRQEIAASRVELLKWCLLFWIGQVVATASLVGVMLRAIR